MSRLIGPCGKHYSIGRNYNLMSLMSMRRKMASKQTATIVLWVLIAVFLLGIYFWSVPNSVAVPKKGGQHTGQGEIVATVNGDAIHSGEIDDAFDAKKAPPDSVRMTILNTLDVRKAIFDDAVKSRVVNQTLKELNLTVGQRDAEAIANSYASEQLAEMEKTAATTQKSNQADPKKPAAEKAKTADQIFVEEATQYMNSQQPDSKSQKYTPTSKDQAKEMFTHWFVDMLTGAGASRAQQFMDHVKMRMIGAVQTKALPVDLGSEDYVKKLQTQEVHAHWIFVAAKPVTPDGMKAAEAKATQARDAVVKAPASFAEVVKKYSDHPASKDNGGDLGWISPQSPAMFNLPRMAEYMAYAQKPGDIGPVYQVTHLNRYVATQSEYGYAFMRVDAVRAKATLPKDFNWDSEKASDMARTRESYEADLGESYLNTRQHSATIICNTPEFAAYEDELNGHYAEATKEYQKAYNQKNLAPEVKAAISYKVALATPEMEKRIPYLTDALPYADTLMSQLHEELGNAYLKTKDKTKAIEEYRYAALSAADSDAGTRARMRDNFTKLGDSKDAGEMKQWLDDHAKAAPKTPTMPPKFGAPGGPTN